MLQRLLAIADTPDDDTELRLSHRLLIAQGGLMSLGGVVMIALVVAVGRVGPALVPFTYVVVTTINFVFLRQTKRFVAARRIQLLASLILPFFFQWSMGGFVESGGVMLWALLGVVGSLLFETPRTALGWLAGFLALTTVSAAAESWLAANVATGASATVQTIFFAVNIGAISTIVFALVSYVLSERNQALKEAREARRQTESANVALDEANFLADIAMDMTHCAHWQYDYSEPDYYYQSERSARMLGEPIKPDGRYHLQDEWFSRLVEANPETAERSSERLAGAIDGRYEHYETTYAYKRPIDGEVIWLHALGKIVRDEQGKMLHMYGAYQDVTRKVADEAALQEAKETAEEATRAKSDFLANMSHELRTPLNAILGYSEMLMEDAEATGDDESAADLRKIHGSGSHLLSLINDVLDLAKIESGKMDVLLEDFEVARLIDDVVATAEPLMGKNGNRLKVTRGDSLGAAHQDLTKLRQSLLNLLSNAAKFTHQGIVTLTAERTAGDGVDWLTLAVRDTGIGIAADKIERVFEEFSQAEETTSRDYGGTGLGLPISRRFCRMLGGELTLESQPGEGSTFSIRVPAALEHFEEAATAEVTPAVAEAELSAIREAGDGRTVLVIDDDPEAREIIERLLAKDDFQVVTAGSGEEGLRLAHLLEPAVITLDVEMREMDGWSVLRALKADPVLRDIPVVMLTILDDATTGYALGATDFLVKPVDGDRLRAVVSRYHTPEAPSLALLVDDEPAVRATVSNVLARSGWEVEQAGNGREALDRLAVRQPTLIVLDLMMPVMDGFDFLVDLHADEGWREIPVIVLTAKDLSDEDRRTLSGRVEQIIEKDSWSHDQLVALVRKLGARSTVTTKPA